MILKPELKTLKVTLEDIYNLSKKVSISTIFSLVGGEDNAKN